MPIEILSETNVRNNMAKIIKEVQDKNNTLFITKNGRAVATLLSTEKYNYLMSELEDKLDEKDEKLAKEVNEARQQYRKGKFCKIEEIILTDKKSKK